MQKLQKVVLHQMRALQDGWDGGTAAKPASLAIERAEEILNSLPEVTPSRFLDGGVLIRWRDRRGNLLAELAITSEGSQELE